MQVMLGASAVVSVMMMFVMLLALNTIIVM